MHDLGKVALNDCFPEEYRQVFERAKESEASLCEADAEAFGVDHGRVGLMIAEKWQLGAALRDSLAHHHDPREADDAGRDLVTLVSLGDGYANMLGMGSPGYPRPDEGRLSFLLDEEGFRAGDLEGYRGKVLEEIEKARVFIQLSSKG